VIETDTETLLDCGTKNSIIRAFIRRNISVIRCPWNYNFLKEKADGVVISNGPGDPRRCNETIENVRRALSVNAPILGICLGSQILGLAAGASTYKLRYGHRSQNQPCVEVGTKRCYITTQNHGYAVDSDTLPEDWREWFYNNNDKTNEGIIHISKPFFGTQFHPETSPGLDDTEFLFDMFVRALKEEAIKTVLVNPNIATIQTSDYLANEVYFVPIDTFFVEKVIEKEKPDGVLLGFGGRQR
jgi:carbamoyl-phosphate synthase small subunit